MASYSYYHFVPYQPDPEKALRDLKEQEFQAGRFFPAQEMFAEEDTHAKQATFHVAYGHTWSGPPPQTKKRKPRNLGKPCANIEQALKLAGHNGTRSILDIDHFHPRLRSSCAYLLPAKKRKELFGTPTPSRALMEQVLHFSYKNPGNSEELLDLMETWGDFEDTITRGQCAVFTLYNGDTPTEYLFYAFTYD